MHFHLTCPVDLPESKTYSQQDTVNIQKANMLTTGLSNLEHRKMEISSYPRYSGGINNLVYFLGYMFTQADRRGRQDRSIYSNTLLEVKETLQIMLLWMLEKPQVSCKVLHGA